MDPSLDPGSNPDSNPGSDPDFILSSLKEGGSLLTVKRFEGLPNLNTLETHRSGNSTLKESFNF